jgi:hypothetical protein
MAAWASTHMRANDEIDGIEPIVAKNKLAVNNYRQLYRQIRQI